MMSFSMHGGALACTYLEGSVIQHVVLEESSRSSLDHCRWGMSHPVQPVNHSRLTNPPEWTAWAHPSPSGERRRGASLDGAVSYPFLCWLLRLRADRVMAIAPRIQKTLVFNHKIVGGSLIKLVEAELASEALESCTPPLALVSVGASGAQSPPKQTSKSFGRQH